MSKIINFRGISGPVLFLAFMLLVITRDIRLFLDPRFWAEEASVYFLSASLHTLSEHFSNVAVGYYSLVNIFSTALASRMVPLQYAPLMTTLSAFAVQLIPAFIIVFGNIKSFADFRIKLLALAIVLFVLPNNEVWLNVINSQFYFAIATALILLHQSRTDIEKLVYRILLFIAGLSGFVSLFLFPVFVFKAIVRNHRETYVQVGILFLAGLIQLYFLLSAGHNLREGNFEPIVFIFIFLLKSICLPLTGIENTLHAAELLKGIYSQSALYSVGIIIFSIAVVILLVKMLKPLYNSDANYLLLASLIIFFFSVYGAMGGKLNLLNASASGRYFFAPNVLLYLSVLALLSPLDNPVRRLKFIPAIIISLLIVVGMANFWSTANNDVSRGPSWKAQIIYNENNLRRIEIWPKGWFVNLNKEDNQLLANCEHNMFFDTEFLCLLYTNKKVKIKILFKNNQKIKQRYDLIAFKILENRNIEKLPEEMIFKQVKNIQSNEYHDVQLKVMDGRELFSANILPRETLIHNTE